MFKAISGGTTAILKLKCMIVKHRNVGFNTNNTC